MRLKGVLAVFGLAVAACSSSVFVGDWVDADGEEVPTSVIEVVDGPREHCGWGSATFLFLARGGPVEAIPDGFADEYIRDPKGLFADRLETSFS